MTGQALERVAPATPAVLSDADVRTIEFGARAIAALDPRLANDKAKDEKAWAMSMTLWSYGVTPSPVAAKKLHLIPAGKGKVELYESAQMLFGLLTMWGHEVWIEDETEERAVVCGRRFGRGRVHRVEYTIERARTSGALDEWVERKVQLEGDDWAKTEKVTVRVDGRVVTEGVPEWAEQEEAAGRIRHNDYWFNYRADALQNRAVRRLAKRLGADALLGVGALAEPDQRRPGAEETADDVVDGELVEDDEVSHGHEPTWEDHQAEASDDEPTGGGAPGPTAATEADEAAAHRNECSRIFAAIGRIPEQWRPAWAKAWREAELPRAMALSPEQLEPARLLVRQFIALSAMDSVGVRSSADRHTFVDSATKGETESTKALTAGQLLAVLGVVNDMKEEERLAAEAEATEVEEQDPAGDKSFDEDDPERPF